jgi:leucyl aminopeptidase
MSLKLTQYAAIGSEKSLSSEKHILLVLSKVAEKNLPFTKILENKLQRSKGEMKDINKTPMSVELPSGGLASYVVLAENLSMFQKHTLLRKAVKPLLDEQPESIAICLFGDQTTKEANACAAYYVTTVNAAELPVRKKDNKHKPLKEISIHGFKAEHDYGYVNARVAGNTLCRSLTMLPPNELNPTSYRAKVKKLAKEHGWTHEEFDMPALKKMGAGAFYAVGQGSEPMDAAIVHLSYMPPVVRQAHHERDTQAHHERDNLETVRPELVEGQSLKHIALVGKGICFDTGGHNLKPAKYMQGMHEDMNGSAVALGVLTAATLQQLPVKIDCWLAIAQNHIGPLAYKQNDVVTALNGMTIEIVHTDAEGRMVLADTLTLASRQKPDVILDYATLTGSMAVAVTDRMSGVIANKPELACKAIGAGTAAGERIVAFPYEEDMDSDLDSDIADIKQCTLEGGGDHMHAARFMGKFIENDVAWLHADLSSTNRKGGLGAVQSDVNGFGVGFGLEMIKSLLK